MARTSCSHELPRTRGSQPSKSSELHKGDGSVGGHTATVLAIALHVEGKYGYFAPSTIYGLLVCGHKNGRLTLVGSKSAGVTLAQRTGGVGECLSKE